MRVWGGSEEQWVALIGCAMWVSVWWMSLQDKDPLKVKFVDSVTRPKNTNST
jgi:hypothetical protein